LRAAALAAPVCLLWNLSGAPAQPAGDPPAELLSRLAAKAQAAELGGPTPAAYQARRVRADHPNSEDLALYTGAPLAESTQAELAARGIRIVPELYIPAVPGRHPEGFHLANVPHPELGFLCSHPSIRRVRSAEVPLAALAAPDDTARAMLRFNEVLAGQCVWPRTGLGVRIGLADSGYDRTSLDLPTPALAFDVTDGDAPESWGLDLSGFYSGHGTHVAGLLVGSGFHSNGLYSAAAPSAALHVYKTANDLDGFNWSADLIKALHHAVQQDVRIFNLSIGAYNDFNDGSDPVEQTVDWAREKGMLVVVAAGNEAQTFGHVQFTLGPGESSPVFNYVIPNFFPETYQDPHGFQVIWRDGEAGDGNLSLSAAGLAPGDGFGEQYLTVSTRETESKRFVLEVSVPPGGQRVIPLQLSNTASSGAPVVVHVYRLFGLGGLTAWTSTSTVMSPGLADRALCVGAWTSKESYVAADGSPVPIPAAQFDGLAPFSAHGPRIDGLAKPDLCAPGVAIISARSGSAPAAALELIDDDGLFGEGSVNYQVRSGTSFAAPMVAAAAALLLEAAPQLSADELEAALLAACPEAASPDNKRGAGRLDAQAALIAVTGAGCQPLIPSAKQLSISTGGRVDFRIEAGTQNAGRFYMLLGSASGMEPGLLLEGQFLLPLVPDGYLLSSLAVDGSLPLTLNFGLLDASGRGLARFELPPAVNPALVGKRAHHAALVFGAEPAPTWIQLVSNPSSLDLLP
jgi:subtilisin family serine protease